MIKDNLRKQVVFIETSMFNKMPITERESLLSKITSLGYKIYTTSNANSLLRLNKPTVHRFGYLVDSISSGVRIRGGNVISGDF